MKIIEQSDHRLRNGMSVADLIAALQDCNPEATVVFACDYGDHCHTQQALPIEECNEIEPGQALVESAYSQSGMALEKSDDGDDQEELAVAVRGIVILK